MSTDYTLSYGTHATPEDGRCAMEWVSYLAGEPHSDEPACVGPVLRAFCIGLNDSFDDTSRQRLRPYLTRTIGTADDGLDEARSWMAMDWLVRVYAPTWLGLAKLTEAARLLTSLPLVLDVALLQASLRPLELARHDASGALAVSRGTGRGAARVLPRAAGRSAARELAWSSAAAAVWAAARLSLGDIAGDRARAAARAAAGDAAALAARQARASSERAATEEAVRSALAPTANALQDSALALLDRMLPTDVLTIDGVAGRRCEPARPNRSQTTDARPLRSARRRLTERLVPSRAPSA
jgi:hypothetical protein